MEEIKEKKKYIYSKDKIKQYNQTYKLKHQDNIIECDLCFKKYSVINRHYHSLSKQHQIAVKILQTLSSPKVNNGEGI